MLYKLVIFYYIFFNNGLMVSKSSPAQTEKERMLLGYRLTPISCRIRYQKVLNWIAQHILTPYICWTFNWIKL